jgi:predicted nucleic acid-binding protein
MVDVSKAVEKFPHKKDKILNLEKRAKIAELLLDVSKHEGMVLLVRQLMETINAMNAKLVQPMDEKARERMLAIRDTCEDFIRIFPEAEQNLETINKKLQKYDV